MLHFLLRTASVPGFLHTAWTCTHSQCQPSVWRDTGNVNRESAINAQPGSLGLPLRLGGTPSPTGPSKGSRSGAPPMCSGVIVIGRPCPPWPLVRAYALHAWPIEMQSRRRRHHGPTACEHQHWPLEIQELNAGPTRPIPHHSVKSPSRSPSISPSMAFQSPAPPCS